MVLVLRILGALLLGADDPPCQAGWSDGFPLVAPHSGPRDTIEFDDGTGAALYIAEVGGNTPYLPCSAVLKWTGTRWAVVGDTRLSGVGRCLAIFDDGAGPKLYVGGNLARVAWPSGKPVRRAFRTATPTAA